MKKYIIDPNEVALKTRKTWGQMNPATKVFKSKKAYNRKNKSWKKERF